MMLVIRGVTPVAVIAAVALGILASLVSGAFAAIVWMCSGGDALTAFIVGSASVPAAVAGGAAWAIYADRPAPETSRAARGGPELWSWTKNVRYGAIDTPAAAPAQ